MHLICEFLKWLALFHLLSQSQSGRVQEAKRHIRAEFRDVLGPPRYYGSHWHHGQRVHRVHMPHARQRWSGRRRSIHHPHPFSRWTQWTTCDEDCIRRRERFCKAKRKCGHTKHVEQRKCSHCHPAIKWHQVESNFHHRNSQPIHIPSQNTPSIVINAAAAAASGPPLQPVHAQPQPQPSPLPQPTVVYPHLPVDSVEVVHRRPPTSHWPPIESGADEEDEDEPAFGHEEGDFFVLKRHRRRQRPKHISWHSSGYSSGHSSGHSLGHSSGHSSGHSLGHSSGHSLGHSSRYNSRHNSKHNSRHQNEEKHKFDFIDDDFEDYFERRSFSHQQRSLGSNENVGLDGDIFQYEDFDFEPDLNQYVDSEEYADNRNSSWLPPNKERNTPDGLQSRHRRMYSKWSRWSKCSPKCTTRRYKKCRIREQCGREVLREIAYCYTEGSFCQQWLQTQVQKMPAYDSRPRPGTATRPVPGTATAMRRMHTEPASASLSKNDVNVIMNGKGYRGPEYTPLKLQCGLLRNRPRNNNMYNMLKIIGGKTARKGAWPWQVAIINRFKEVFCGGTLIAPFWVLTAAHCVRKVLYVRFGEHNLDYEDGTEVQLRVLKSYKHPNFDKRTVDSDVALLSLPKKVNSTRWIGYSCLPRPYQPLPENVHCTVIGWGKRRNSDVVGTSVLHQADVPIIPMGNCSKVYRDYTITKNMFCAGHSQGRIDTCAGDSGGPLLCRDTTKANHPWTIFGITSFGDGCGKRNKFGIYVRMPNYVDWVWSVVNCNGNCKLH
ncbi:uncharacterized protein LOC6557425 [Drosophila grimshawi]|uniref:uncharacterized protein LOC6557425 n=1 Tax=Drosophila grimshawi TaxID=7222 RepID=UPI000C870C71|nr:uncharacterized protein LOC6557425 [Drosophila grimshawi]